MGRLPKPVAPQARSLPIFPTPAPADYSDDVSEGEVEKLRQLVSEDTEDADEDEWELVDGPAW